MGRDPVLVDDAPAAPTLDGAGGARHRPPGTAHCRAATSWSRARASAVTARRWRQLEEAGVAVCGGLGLFMAEADPDPRRLHHRHEGKEHDDGAGRPPARPGSACAPGPAGTSGVPPWDPVGRAGTGLLDRRDVELPGPRPAQRRPAVVAVTSLSPDHLDWHGTVERYYADKLSLCTKPGRGAGPAPTATRTLRAQAELARSARPLGAPSDEVAQDDALVGRARPAGPHNARNASLARPCSRASASRAPTTTGWPPSRAGLRRAAQPLSVAGHPSARSSSSTTASRPTCCRPGRAATPSIDRPVALLVGGHDRGVDYTPLGRTMARRTRRRSWSPCPTTARASDRPCRADGGQVEVIDAGEPRRGRDGRVRVAPGRRRGPALAGRPELRPLRRLPRALAAFAERPPPVAGRSAEQRQQPAPAGASSSRSLRKSHHESADTVAAACTTSGSAPNAGQGLDRPARRARPPGCGARPRSGCPPRRTRSGGADRRPSRPRCRRPGPRRRPPWPEQPPGRSTPWCAPRPAAPRSRAWPERRPPRRRPPRKGLEELRVRRGCSRARRPGSPRRGRGPGPAAAPTAMAASVTGSSRSMCRYCSA